ncbi:MAG: hypothetical protein ACO3DH_09135 [Candidatus Kapaibacteriota bacterium]
MKTIILPFITLLLMSFNGCFVPEPLSPEDTKPLVREATLAVFNSTTYLSNKTPDSLFTIATFRFPSSTNSSGSLPNDQRFLNGNWTFQEANFPLPGYTAEYIFQEPPNSLQAGDILVDSIFIHPTNPILSKVVLRFKGRFARIPRATPQLTEDADSLANVFMQLANDTLRFFTGCDQFEKLAVQYGDVKVGRLYSITATNPNGTPQRYDYPTNWPTAKDIAKVLPPFKRLPAEDMDTYTAEFGLGDVFYYMAENGNNFFVSVSNIRESILTPGLKRVTFKFAEAYYCTICNPL